MGTQTTKQILMAALLGSALSQAQPQMRVIPGTPGAQDWVWFSINNGYGCDLFHNVQVHRQQHTGSQRIELYDEVEHFDICIEPVENNAEFTSPPLYPGTYAVWQGEVPYCDTTGGVQCPIYDVHYVEVGSVTVSDPTGPDEFVIRETGATCFVEPCGYYLVINPARRDTTPVHGLQDLGGSYCMNCGGELKRWQDGTTVRGYFHEDSLPNWVTRGEVFAITEYAPGVGVLNGPGIKESSFEVAANVSGGILEFQIPGAGDRPVEIFLYKLDGKQLGHWTLSARQDRGWYRLDGFQIEAGAYSLLFKIGQKNYRRLLAVP